MVLLTRRPRVYGGSRLRFHKRPIQLAGALSLVATYEQGKDATVFEDDSFPSRPQRRRPN